MALCVLPTLLPNNGFWREQQTCGSGKLEYARKSKSMKWLYAILTKPISKSSPDGLAHSWISNSTMGFLRTVAGRTKNNGLPRGEVGMFPDEKSQSSNHR